MNVNCNFSLLICFVELGINYEVFSNNELIYVVVVVILVIRRVKYFELKF